jgi:N-acetylglucosamine PTS system EIICBA or EIICB component
MYHAAKPERKKAVGGMLASLALTAFLTGVTEPIEFTFMFLAPALYIIHAILTGAAMVVMDLLDVHLGFTFSAGLFDYVLNYGQSTRPWLLIPIGLVYGAIYYGLFRVAIRVLDLKTPGREDEPVSAAPAASAGLPDRARDFVIALGGAANLRSVAACTTRLRLGVVSRDAVDEPALKRLGARGVISPSPDTLQVVLGPIADAVAQDIRDALGSGETLAMPAQTTVSTLVDPAVLKALGGQENLMGAVRRAGRLCVSLARPDIVDDAALRAVSPRGFVKTASGAIHILEGV